MFLRLLFGVIFISSISFAQVDARKLKIDARKPIKLDYLAPAWNKDPSKVESSAILIRDAITGRMVKVEVIETGSNTSFFVGTYRINFSGDVANFEMTAEVYIAPLAMLKSDQQLKRTEALIKEGTLLRKPYFMRTEHGVQTLSVFDSRAQAMEAFKSFQANGIGRQIVDPAAYDAQSMALKTAEEKERASATVLAEQNRAKLEEEEKKKQAELKKNQEALSTAEKERRKKQAEVLAKEGLELYQKDNFVAAESKFNESIELDPSNTAYAFQYGVVLYRNEKFNKAIVVLRLAKGPGVNENERDYFIALSHLRLKEYEPAYQVFSSLKSSENKTFSGAAGFYSGVIDFQKEKYDEAKTNFEFVLDHSNDPKMDQQAEAFIEQISNIKRFEEMRKKRFILSANFGLLYDSNILSVASADSPTDLAGYRWTYGISGEYRPVFSEHNEWSTILSFSDMYSTDPSLKAKPEFQNTDPLIMNLSFPYKWKGEALGKPVQLGLTPAYETITMNVSGAGRKAIINSTILKADGTFVMNEDLFANYGIEVRRDTSLISVAGDDDQTANKLTLSTSQTTFQDKKKTLALIGDGALGMNMAQGRNLQYNRLDLGASFMGPGVGDTIFVSRFSLGYALYPNHAVGRTDTSLGLTMTLQKQFTEAVGWSLTGGFTKNGSTISTYAYDKFTIMTGLNWKNAF